MDGTGGAVAQAGGLFAGLGADVIKVENRTYPDGARIARGGTMNANFVAGHRGKRSIGIDLQAVGLPLARWGLPHFSGALVLLVLGAPARRARSRDVVVSRDHLSALVEAASTGSLHHAVAAAPPQVQHVLADAASQGFLTGLNDIRLAGAVLSFLGPRSPPGSCPGTVSHCEAAGVLTLNQQPPRQRWCGAPLPTLAKSGPEPRRLQDSHRAARRRGENEGPATWSPRRERFGFGPS